MGKFPTFLMLLAVSVLAAGLYGMLHNQLSYSVGSAYFHQLKFPQFGIAAEHWDRWGAALVGWKASWWMGLLIGLPAFGLGMLWIGQPQHLLGAGLGAIGIVLMVALFCAMLGLLLGMAVDPQALADHVAMPAGIASPDGFLRAALMHEGSYLGGALGLLLAVATMWRVGRIERAQAKTRI